MDKDLTTTGKGLMQTEITGTGFEVNPESWTQLKGSNEKRI